ncbi:MAG: hypothetical protein JO086_01050 [Acidimicrobiia bacterium]|nr:hypothetical protein [Acidimicrobiia bacterium]
MAWLRRQPIPEAWFLLVAGLCILVFVVAEVTWFGGRPARAEAGAATVRNSDPDLTGQLRLENQGFFLSRSAVGGPCKGLGPESDLLGGTPVVLKDEDGAVLATGALDIGRVTDHSTCTFNFVVPSVPKNVMYRVDVGDRGLGALSHDELVAQGWRVTLAVG